MPNGNNSPKEPRVQPNTRGHDRSGMGHSRPLPRSVVRWDDMDTNENGRLVCTVTAAGAGVIFGRTSASGALSLTVLDGESRIREYFRTVEEFEALSVFLARMFEDC